MLCFFSSSSKAVPLWSTLPHSTLTLHVPQLPTSQLDGMSNPASLSTSNSGSFAETSKVFPLLLSSTSNGSPVKFAVNASECTLSFGKFELSAASVTAFIMRSGPQQ